VGVLGSAYLIDSAMARSDVATNSDGNPTSTTEPGSLSLMAVGVVALVLGVSWWAFDADPSRGKFILVAGVALVVLAQLLRGRLGASGKRLVLVVAVLLALLLIIDAVHLVQVINDQRAAHLG
jgi:hypothetical protein